MATEESTPRTKSTNLNLNKKLLEFQKKIQVIKRDGKNPHFKSSYATLPQILAEVKPLLNELGLIIIQPISHNAVLTVITDAESGESITGQMYLPTSDVTPQILGSNITYYRRYILAGLLALEIDGDDDGNAASAMKLPVKDERVWLNKGTEEYKKAKEYVAGGGDIEKIAKKYKLSKEVYASLSIKEPA